MLRETIKRQLQGIVQHKYLELTTRGNTAIDAALSIIPAGQKILIPEEGGWLHYKTGPKKIGLLTEEVKCDDAAINLDDLRQKLHTDEYAALLYQNPGGYHAEQPVREIYTLCRKHNCLVISDISGAIGTPLGKGDYADILVCSFGTWKLVEAKAGGFISTNNSKLWDQLQGKIKTLRDEKILAIIRERLNELPKRIQQLAEIRNTVLAAGQEQGWKILHPHDFGTVVIVPFATEREKQKIIKYCTQNQLEWTECPRYIRLNTPAISIEIKRK